MTLYYYLPDGTDPRPLIVRTEPIIGRKPYKVVMTDKDGNITTITTIEHITRKYTNANNQHTTADTNTAGKHE